MKIEDAIVRAKARIRHHMNMVGIYDDMADQREYHRQQADVLRTLLDEIERLRNEKKKQEG